MDWRLQRVTEPARVVEASVVKQHLRVDTSVEDTLIERYIDAAVASIEGQYGIGVLMNEQQWKAFFDRFYGIIRLPLFPVKSIDAIKYIDQDGDEQTLDASVYRVDTVSNPARITTEFNQTWPITRAREPNAVTVEFTGGFDTVPKDLEQAVILFASHLFENRQPVVEGTRRELPMAVEAILSRYRVPGIG
ncbi:MAG: hypothetical protein FKY71_12680 [Spiribacter salinus]|uniref:Phage gp6-like head-tail connector protein n=1 Tax=Spiribacter salinus TaxID=1335746 RepID=A0A540VPK5_9GAMM|nr:MAG: hypothetical protein FKY71_12680 [Spiribacter salinus]